MGHAKEQWIRQTELGYSNVPNKTVCAECISDYALKAFIKEEANEYKCSYCSKESGEPIAVALVQLVDYICECIHTEWVDPAGCMWWDSAEGGYHGASVYTGYELVMYEIEELYETDNMELLEDIASSLDDSSWCQRDPYGLRDEEALIYSWEHFSNLVKHKVRYNFSRFDDEEQRKYDPDRTPVSKVLDRIADEILGLAECYELIVSLKKDCMIFRARVHKKDEPLSTAKDLCAVPLDKAKYSNRMSPAGIPMFYGALDADTAYQEIMDETKDNKDKVVYIATFKALRPMMALNLGNLPEVPSIFNREKNHLRSSIIFLHSFSREISKPINKDGFEHIEYVPTQVFTEYTKHFFRFGDHGSIDGILYPSSKHDGGVSCVLFIENEQCCDEIQTQLDEQNIQNTQEPVKYLLLEGIESRPLD